MKVALVHDYIKEYGGAERVLEALCEIFPEAPIYTAFYKKDSIAYQKFKDKKIIASWVQNIPFFATKLHSPLRFLAPFIWGSFDFSDYDIVISSASWYVTKGFGRRNSSCHPEFISGSPVRRQAYLRSREMLKQVQHDIGEKPIEICYCHTPPRWLYGYKTSVEWQKFWPIKVYGIIVGHLMRLYDFSAAQRVDYFIANSEEVKNRIKKFYKRDAVVIYPPVSLNSKSEYRNSKSIRQAQDPEFTEGQIQNSNFQNSKKEIASPAKLDRNDGREDYYFIVSRLVGSKGLDLAVEAASKLGFKLKIAGAPAGYYTEYKRLIGKGRGSRNKFGMTSNNNVEFLGHVTDEELAVLYTKAKAFLAMSQDEDFGITPVEAMSFGTPVIAYNGGGYKETVIDGKTGLFFNEQSAESLINAINKFETLRQAQGKKMSEDCIKQAQKFSKEEFKRKMFFGDEPR